MRTLREELDLLNKLNARRQRAIDLRNRGSAGLDEITYVEESKKQTEGNRPQAKVHTRTSLEPHPQWIGMGNKIEAVLLAKVQRSRRLTHKSHGDGRVHEELDRTFKSIGIDDLLPLESRDVELDMSDNAAFDRRMPVLLAAHAMQVLTSRASTAVSAQTLICYYAILHELNLAMPPDWTIGAARAGQGGTASSFITGECIRAILCLERAHHRTAEFLRRTRVLNEQYLTLRGVRSLVGALGKDHPLQRWIEQAIQRMWLDWLVSTHPQRGEVCFAFDGFFGKRLKQPLEEINFEQVRRFLQELVGELKKAFEEVERATVGASVQIREHMMQPKPVPVRKPPGRAKRAAHEYAYRVIVDAKKQARETIGIFDRFPHTGGDDDDHVALLSALERKIEEIASSIHRVLEPSKHYVENAFDRAIAESDMYFDPGDLVFSACSYGAVTNWQSSSRRVLQRACAMVLKAVPENGMLASRHPILSSRRGYKLFPTSCEVVRALAVLIERTAYDLSPAEIEAIERLIDAIDDKKLDVDYDAFGWNFDGATEQDRPSIWVTAVTVHALDRVVRMLDSRINAMVYRHFDVKAFKPKDITLNKLIYSDYGFALGCPQFDTRRAPQQRTPIAIRLEEMRAHLLRVPMPGRSGPPVFSAVIYGPPQTGKTTLAEALARSSGMPLVRLSSFDLTHDPRESIESRARVIFDALSMLTNTVILFDEFESVLQGREERHELSLEFLLTGLLPKLVNLHDLARSQGLVYFLATNHIERIDAAAIRRGRFDLQLPVYTPDPLSRVAACLYRLQIFRSRVNTAENWKTDAWSLDAHAAVRVLNTASEANGLPPSDLATEFFRLPERDHELKEDWGKTTPYFAYILDDYDGVRPQPVDVKEETLATDASVWDQERVWLTRFEYSFQLSLREQTQYRAGKRDQTAAVSAADILEACLRLPAARTT